MLFRSVAVGGGGEQGRKHLFLFDELEEICVPDTFMIVVFEFCLTLTLEKGYGFKHDLARLLVEVFESFVFGMQYHVGSSIRVGGCVSLAEPSHHG